MPPPVKRSVVERAEVYRFGSDSPPQSQKQEQICKGSEVLMRRPHSSSSVRVNVTFLVCCRSYSWNGEMVKVVYWHCLVTAGVSETTYSKGQVSSLTVKRFIIPAAIKNIPALFKGHDQNFLQLNHKVEGKIC